MYAIHSTDSSGQCRLYHTAKFTICSSKFKICRLKISKISKISKHRQNVFFKNAVMSNIWTKLFPWFILLYALFCVCVPVTVTLSVIKNPPLVETWGYWVPFLFNLHYCIPWEEHQGTNLQLEWVLYPLNYIPAVITPTMIMAVRLRLLAAAAAMLKYRRKQWSSHSRSHHFGNGRTSNFIYDEVKVPNGQKAVVTFDYNLKKIKKIKK